MTSVISKDAIGALMRVQETQRDLKWIKDALQAAVALEIATMPPYLCGYWSIKDTSGTNATVASTIRQVLLEEMLHMGLVCNILNAVGGTPSIVGAASAITYPGRLPGGVRPELTVGLGGLTKQRVHDVFMEIEMPEDPLARAADTYPTIGAFYAALSTAFQTVQPPISPIRQVTTSVGGYTLFAINNLGDVQRAITLICEQGEGTSTEPNPDGELAHYYQFGEIYHGRRLVYNESTKKWEWTGADVPFPAAANLRPMGELPAGGWPNPSSQVSQMLDSFNAAYRSMLVLLDQAWTNGASLGPAIGAMYQLGTPAIALMDTPNPSTPGTTYGPDFKIATT